MATVRTRTVVVEFAWVGGALILGWWLTGTVPIPGPGPVFYTPYSIYVTYWMSSGLCVAMFLLGWRCALLVGWRNYRSGGVWALRTALLASGLFVAVATMAGVPMRDMPRFFANQLPEPAGWPLPFDIGAWITVWLVTLAVILTTAVLSVAGLWTRGRVRRP